MGDFYIFDFSISPNFSIMAIYYFITRKKMALRYPSLSWVVLKFPLKRRFEIIPLDCWSLAGAPGNVPHYPPHPHPSAPGKWDWSRNWWLQWAPAWAWLAAKVLPTSTFISASGSPSRASCLCALSLCTVWPWHLWSNTPRGPGGFSSWLSKTSSYKECTEQHTQLHLSVPADKPHCISLTLACVLAQMRCLPSSCAILCTMATLCWCRTPAAASYRKNTSTPSSCSTLWAAGPRMTTCPWTGGWSNMQLYSRKGSWIPSQPSSPSSHLPCCMLALQRWVVPWAGPWDLEVQAQIWRANESLWSSFVMSRF